MSGITAHMIVKNEDQWVWYALQAILPYVDKVLVIDTGSTDQTVPIIQLISSPKIQLSFHKVHSASDLTNLRNLQLQQTTTPWIWLVDGDEVNTKKGAQEIVRAATPDRHGIAVRRYDLLGDIYHRQLESVGEYRLLGTRGHLVTRLINRSHFPGLHVGRPYPLEAYLDQDGKMVHSYATSKWYLTQEHLYHAMYLKRSSLGGNLAMLNRHKYKVETGLPIQDDLPEVFSLLRPALVPNPLVRRSIVYELAATIITPVKNLKRKIL